MPDRQSTVAFTGLRHLALRVRSVSACKRFYIEMFGMRVVWEPDPANVYLSSGCDNLALHEDPGREGGGAQRLDHLGILVETEADVRRAAERFTAAGVPLARPVRTHRDGSCSFYVEDPDGNLVQVLYEPTIGPLRVAARPC